MGKQLHGLGVYLDANAKKALRITNDLLFYLFIEMSHKQFLVLFFSNVHMLIIAYLLFLDYPFPLKKMADVT